MDASDKLYKRLKDPQWKRVFAWVLDTQRQDIRDRYTDQAAAQDLRDFFFDNLYPDIAMRLKQERRNRDFERISNNWFLSKLLGEPRIAALKNIVTLHNYTDMLDIEVVDYLCRKLDGGDPAQLAVEDYHEAYRATSAMAQREYQLQMIVKSFDFVKKIVTNPQYSLEHIMNKAPTVFLRSSELLTFAVNAYNAFKSAAHDLDDYERLIIDREQMQMHAIFGEEPDPV